MGCWKVRLDSEQFGKSLFRDSSLSNEGSESSLRQFAMIRHNKPATVGMAKDDVAAGLVVNLVANLLKYLDGILP